MLNQKQTSMIMMGAAIILLVIGFGYVKSVESALLQGHTTGPDNVCRHDQALTCPYQQINSLALPKYIGSFLLVILFACGLYLFQKKTPKEHAVSKAKTTAKNMGADESKIFNIITESEGMLFQNELVEKSGLSKVKVTRVLDKLESRGLLERRRRGMTNVIVLK